MSTISFPDVKNFVMKWTPRVIVIGFAGYYGLGLAYQCGLMAVIDKIAIAIIGHATGTAGVGALMPTFQWYSAWAVRFACALAAELTYEVVERIARHYLSPNLRPRPA